MCLAVYSTSILRPIRQRLTAQLHRNSALSQCNDSGMLCQHQCIVTKLWYCDTTQRSDIVSCDGAITLACLIYKTSSSRYKRKA